jgi:hypothetical protein
VPQVTVGDFNQPKIDWITLTSVGDPKCVTLLDLCQSNGLSQLVTEPTRERNILDLIFTNDPQIISTLQVNEPFSTSDHNLISFDICCCTSISTLTADDNNLSEYQVLALARTLI